MEQTIQYPPPHLYSIRANYIESVPISSIIPFVTKYVFHLEESCVCEM